MIRWTPAGAVASPKTLQIRVMAPHRGRVRVGAPEPSRGLTTAEFRANIVHFTEGMTGPRVRPCTELVLSGSGLLARDDFEQCLRTARASGIETVTLHLSSDDLHPRLFTRATGLVNRVVIPMQNDPRLTSAVEIAVAAKSAGLGVSTNTLLTSEGVSSLPALIDRLVSLRPDLITLTHPFPTRTVPAELANPQALITALDSAFSALDRAGLRAQLKGLPACHAGSHLSRMSRTKNRWYVDADHQGASALMFFPDVVAFFKNDACRFCSADNRCDGGFAHWLDLPNAQQLQPIDQYS